MARKPLNGNPKKTSSHGQFTLMGKFKKHLGVDYAVKNEPFFAPSNGRVTGVFKSTSLGNYIEADFLGYTWRFCHLSSVSVSAGQDVTEGQQLGVSGNTGVTTGAHLHYDARMPGTKWDASFNNYKDPDVIVADANTPAQKSFRVAPGKTFRVYQAGTTKELGKLTHEDGWYIIRGTDPKYPNRWLINSGRFGNGIAFPWANIKLEPYTGEYEVR